MYFLMKFLQSGENLAVTKKGQNRKFDFKNNSNSYLKEAISKAAKTGKLGKEVFYHIQNKGFMEKIHYRT